MGNPANENRAADAAYTAATRQVNDLNGVTAFVKASGEKLLPRRRLALALLGPDLAVRESSWSTWSMRRHGHRAMIRRLSSRGELPTSNL